MVRDSQTDFDRFQFVLVIYVYMLLKLCIYSLAMVPERKDKGGSNKPDELIN